MDNKKKLAIGIDLGTTNSCVGIWNNFTSSVDIIENEEGCRTTPSVVGFDKTTRYIGQSAIRQQVRNPKNTVYEVKRLIGRNYNDKIVQNDIAQWPFEVIELGDNKPIIHISLPSNTLTNNTPPNTNINTNNTSRSDDITNTTSNMFPPEQISAMILEKMKQIAQNYVDSHKDVFGDCDICEAVITVPAYFNDGQKQATRDSGFIAGLNVLRIIPEPTAAALAYGLDQLALEKEGDMNVLIFDLGGGTFDVSLLSFNREDNIFEVRAISGDSHLGGADFDQRIVEFCAKDFCEKNDINYDELIKSHRAMQKLRLACERAKKVLSSTDNTYLEIDSLYNDIDYNPLITREKFEDLCSDLFEKCIKPVNQVLFDSYISPDDVHEIVLVGGSTRIPRIQELLSNRFNGKTLCKAINPDEAVAYGATIQAAILSSDTETANNVPDVLLLDACPLSLGVELVGGMMSQIIPRNTTIPTSKSKMFSTSEDNQSSVTIRVFEGERPETKHNRLLGTFELNGIEPSSRGTPKIEVQFCLDADGILTVSANDTTNENSLGRSKQLVIKNEKGRLSEDEISKMVDEAKTFKEQDELFKKLMKAKATFENYLFELKRILTQDTTLLNNSTEQELNTIETTFRSEWDWFKQVTDQNLISNPSNFLDRLDHVQRNIIQPIVEAINDRSK